MSKYKSTATEVDGIRFDSKKEAARYADLKLLVQAGEVRNLIIKPKYPLKVNGQLICTYIPDFEYLAKSGDRVVEDVKGFRTREYAIKAKLMLACHGIQVKET